MCTEVKGNIVLASYVSTTKKKVPHEVKVTITIIHSEINLKT
jgi:hypothetical protein